MVEVNEAAERGPMKQQCYMPLLYLNWVVYLGVISWAGFTGRYFFSLIWALGFPAVLLAYLALFPRISHLLGYGSVADEPAAAPGSADPVAGDPAASESEAAPVDAPPGPAGEGLEPDPVEVTLYRAVGCPFCPIVEQRLDEIERDGGITLRKIDVTLRPGTLASKGIKAVPVVEVGGERITGNATSRQLAMMVERARPSPV